jgi:hypothetical protein
MKMSAIPCRYAVEGLGFFFIPQDRSVKQKMDARAALIRVIKGSLAVQEVVSKLERLIPGDWSWKVEDVGHNLFRTIFPLKNELLRMVEWGVVQSKFNKSKFQIEECMVDAEVKYVLPKVWIQFSGLPPHHRNYLTIWVVVSILGVTKEVDMVFTRHFDINHLQDMVMDPTLIPQRVNVVIGEGMYELILRVEGASTDYNA